MYQTHKEIRSAFAFIVLLLLTCCKENKNEILTAETTKTITQSAEPNDDNLEGVWVRKDYVSNLKKNNSPFQSYIHLEGIASLIISSEAENGSKKVSFNLGNVEASEAILLNNKGKKQLKFRWGDKQYNSSDVVFENNEISFDVDSKKLSFVKADRKMESFGVDYMTNVVLFQNKNFSCYNEKNQRISTNIKLNPDGTIDNFLHYKFYSVQNAFVVDVNPKDIITLKNSDKTKEDFFHFKIKGKAMLLYEINIIKDTLHSEDYEAYEDSEELKLKYVLKY